MRLSLSLTLGASASSNIWQLLMPAVPDCLVQLGDNHYEASWWKPVPLEDIEMMKRNERIRVLGEPFEPKDLAGGLALHFQIFTQSFSCPPLTRPRSRCWGATLIL